MKTRYDEAIGFVSAQLRQSLEKLDDVYKEKVHEIRLRSNKPVILSLGNECKLVDRQGRLLECANGQELLCSYECLEQTFRAICGYSVHTHQREMIRGYITLKGGHRAGFGATAVENDGTVASVKEISSINIRVARQIFAAADALLPVALKGGLLLAGRPGSGKTTLLRDLVRQLSGSGPTPGKKVTILDERGELAAVWDGIPQNDVGMNTDVLNGFSKAIAMEMAVRSLSPDVVVCDEIGSRKEAEGLLGCLQAGVQVIASVHAGSMEELKEKYWVMAILKAGVFPFIALLDAVQGNGQIERIYQTNEWLAEVYGNDFGGDGSELPGVADCRAL